jgi:fatty acid desaturase
MSANSNGMNELRQADNFIYVQVAAIYLLFALTIAWAAGTPATWPGFALVSLVAWALIGWGQFALFNALHEGLHSRFGKPHRHFCAYILCAYPVGFKESYRPVHLDHHRYFGDPLRDPDYVSYADFPSNRRQMLRRGLMNLVGIYALLQFFGIRQQRETAALNEGRNHLGGSLEWLKLVMVQVALLLLMTYTVGWYYYIWLWLIPIVTFGKFYAFLRTFCEHASPDNAATIRTITGSGLGVKLLGVFNFHYHAEHHAHVFVPCARLPLAHQKVSAELYACAEGSDLHYEHYAKGYFSLLWHWFKQLPA